jgi:hypothetical protein
MPTYTSDEQDDMSSLVEYGSGDNYMTISDNGNVQKKSKGCIGALCDHTKKGMKTIRKTVKRLTGRGRRTKRTRRKKRRGRIRRKKTRRKKKRGRIRRKSRRR